MALSTVTACNGVENTLHLALLTGNMGVILAGQEFARVGLQNCGINSSLPVGTVLHIPFLVWDNGRPPLKATANRTLVITSPCTSGTLPVPPPTFWSSCHDMTMTYPSAVLCDVQLSLRRYNRFEP